MLSSQRYSGLFLKKAAVFKSPKPARMIVCNKTLQI